MKNLIKPLLIVAVAILTFSCSPEETVEQVDNQTKQSSGIALDDLHKLAVYSEEGKQLLISDQGEKSLRNKNDELKLKTGPNILGAMVAYETCYMTDSPGYATRYLIYAHANVTAYKPYKREVQLYVTKRIDGITSIIDVKNVIIPQNDGNSNSVPIFYNETSRIGDIKVYVAHVRRLDNSQIDNSIPFLTTTHDVNNCYTSESNAIRENLRLKPCLTGDGNCTFGNNIRS
jgi:hypothetical protein